LEKRPATKPTRPDLGTLFSAEATAAITDEGKGMVRALIFDLDGLLVDSEPLAAKAMDDFLIRYRLERRPWVHARMLGRRLPEAIAIVREGYELNQPLDDLIDVYAKMRLDALRGVVQALPGGREAIAWGREHGMKLGLASSGMRQHVDLSLSETGLAGRFDAEITGDDVARGKPAPDLFLDAAARLGVEPADCVVFDDAPAGVAAGKAAGMRVIAVPHAGTPRAHFQPAPDVFVASLHDAIPVLDAWLAADLASTSAIGTSSS
jgi:beta-phosphoglucomutase-like phosphatase (HAD superfamily)